MTVDERKEGRGWKVGERGGKLGKG